MITVVVSVYNTGKYLPKAMDCLLRQTYRDYEIIIVDDGSTDGSQDICDREAEGRDNVRVFHKPNGGLSSARNFGIDHAKGDYIIFPDPDDWVELNYLEKLVAIREETGADLSICGHFDEMDSLVRIWNQGARPCVMPASEAMEVLMTPSAFCGYAWNKLYDLRIILRRKSAALLIRYTLKTVFFYKDVSASELAIRTELNYVLKFQIFFFYVN